MQIGETDYYVKELIIALMDIHMFNLKSQNQKKNTIFMFLFILLEMYSVKSTNFENAYKSWFVIIDLTNIDLENEKQSVSKSTKCKQWIEIVIVMIIQIDRIEIVNLLIFAKKIYI